MKDLREMTAGQSCAPTEMEGFLNEKLQQQDRLNTVLRRLKRANGRISGTGSDSDSDQKPLQEAAGSHTSALKRDVEVTWGLLSEIEEELGQLERFV